MRRKVYIETTIASYLTARRSRDLVVAARQELTFERWTTRRDHYDCFVSEPVLREAARGDHEAASRRLAGLAGVPSLDFDEQATRLAIAFLNRRLIPEKAAEDALHVAIATTAGMDFLLTWNCRHIANAAVIRRLEELCLQRGYFMPTVCTPDQLMGN